MALGVWSGISGLGVALGPVIGGAIVNGISWHWIFWVNVPVGLVVAPLAAARLSESRGPAGSFDLPGVVLAGTGMALVFAPAANAVLSAVAPTRRDRNRARSTPSARSAVVLGVSVLATVVTSTGGYATPQIFIEGLVPAVLGGAAVLGAGAIAALLVPRRRASAQIAATVETPVMGMEPALASAA